MRRDKKGYPKGRRVGEVREKKGMRGRLAGQKKRLETETLFYFEGLLGLAGFFATPGKRGKNPGCRFKVETVLKKGCQFIIDESALGVVALYVERARETNSATLLSLAM
jgi:hypothetical protein